MNQRILLIAGVILFLTGCLASASLGLLVANAMIDGVFSNIVTESPSNPFASFNCPILLTKNESSGVSVSITNQTTDTLSYSVYISSAGFQFDPSDSKRRIILAGGKTATLHWLAVPVSSGNQAIVVQATSDRDAALTGPFHLWPTSFRQACGVLVISGPFTGVQVIYASVFSILSGAGIITEWLIQKLRERAERGR